MTWPAFLLFPLALLPSESVASSLSLVAEHPGGRDWSLGDTVRLSYVVETRADTRVSCSRDGRVVSSYVLSVPTRTVRVRVRRLILVRNASINTAGRYVCRATSGGASRAVGWRVRVKPQTACQATHLCREVVRTGGGPESSDMCSPCGCPAGKSFYGRNREYRCYDNGRSRLALEVKKRSYVFYQFDPLVVDYDIRTYGDTQVRRRARNQSIVSS